MGFGGIKSGAAGVLTYPNFASLPTSVKDGTVAVTLDNHIVYVFDINTLTWSTAVPTTSFTTENERHVTKNGDDATGDGSIADPWLTVQGAMDSITDAALNKQYAVIVHPGVYLEPGLTIKPNIKVFGYQVGGVYPDNNTTVIECAGLSFDASWNGASLNSGGFANITLRPASGSFGIDLSGTTATLASFYFENVWFPMGANVVGYNDGIQAGNYFVFKNCGFLETLSFTCGGTFLLSCFLSNNLSLISAPVVGTAVSCFNSTVTNTTTANCAVGETLALIMQSTPSGSLNILAGGLLTFAGTADSFPPIASINITGSPTISRFSDAFGLGYTPTTAGDWDTVPATAQAALDTLATSGVADQQAANEFLAAPDGATGLPSFRAMVAADVPALPYAPTTRSISTTAPITGGGDLSADRTIAIPAATTSVDGHLTATDWNTFNNKQPAGSYITALTGPVTASGPGSAATSITNNAITNAMLAQMAAHTFKGNNTAGTANAIDLTRAQLTAELDLFDSTLQGVVPGSGGGTTNFLRADGNWTSPAGSGVTTMAAVGSSPNANAASISGVTLTLQPCDNTNPGVLTTGTQDVGGQKTFRGNTLIANDSTSAATIGGIGNTKQHAINGGLRLTRRTITANLTVDTTTTDHIIICNHSGAITITLPAHGDGRRLTIIDKSGAASTNNITLARNGGTGKIQGLTASYIMQTDFGSKVLESDGADWWFE